MGFILDTSAPEFGEYATEVRSESFYLHGETPKVAVEAARHGIFLYPHYLNERQGSIELLLEDIPKLRAILDAVEAYVKEERGVDTRT